MTEQRPPHQRAADLLRFLSELRQLGARPVTDFSRYDLSLALSSLPDHPAVIAGVPPNSTWPELLLQVHRLPLADPPQPEGILDGWIDAPIDDPELPPQLRPNRPDPLSDLTTDRVAAAEVEGLIAAYDGWFSAWQAWAEGRLADQPARDLYKKVFDAYGQLERSDEHELVLGIGMLGWALDGARIRRHLVTAPAQVDLDPDTGTLTVTLDRTGSAQLEDDLIAQLPIADQVAARMPALRTEISETPILPATGSDHTPDDDLELGDVADAVHLLDDDSPVRLAVRRLVLGLDPDASIDDDASGPAPIGGAPRVHLAPMLLVRAHGDAGIIKLLGDIITDLEDSEIVPDGLMPLVDLEQPMLTTEPPEYGRTGAFPELDEHRFGPVPLNERQEQVLAAVDRNPSVLVQGPPGTGKTHTIGALLTHLLAQGKRVLVTAHTDQALVEVRNKLPVPMQPLAVSVIGRGRTDNASLDTAVAKLSERAGTFDPAAVAAEIRHLETDLNAAAERRAAAKRAIYTAREHIVTALQHGPYAGRAGAIANELVEQAEELRWLHDEAGVDRIAGGAPLDDSEARELARLWHEPDLTTDAGQARLGLVHLDDVPDPSEFAALVTALDTAEEAARTYDGVRDTDLSGAVAALEPEVRAQLLQMLTQLNDTAVRLSNRDEAWMDTALQDVLSGRAKIWTDRATKIRAELVPVTALLDTLPAGSRVTVSGEHRSQHRTIAEGLRAWLGGGKTIATDLAGNPKIGVFTSPTIKQAQPLFDAVTVNGTPPTDAPMLAMTIAWLEAAERLDELDRAWPEDVPVPDHDTPSEQASWHGTELQALTELLAFAGQLEATVEVLDRRGVVHPALQTLEGVHEFATAVETADADDELSAARRPTDELEAALLDLVRGGGVAASTVDLYDAVTGRDVDAYLAAHNRTANLIDVAARVYRRDGLDIQVRGQAPHLADRLKNMPQEQLRERMERFGDAWWWAATHRWLTDRDVPDIAQLHTELSEQDIRLRRLVVDLAEQRAWHEALGRITPAKRAALINYAQRVKKLGAGTGKYAPQRRKAVQQALNECRDAVPVWILPLHRIEEQFQSLSADMFDVVIVDEASQVRSDAIFLQYLAPKIVVVGDDRQTVPEGGFVNQQDIYDLGKRYLPDDSYQAMWTDTQLSLFDIGVQRYGVPITLVEHHRCAPEIIAWCNKVAYMPKVELLPVRAMPIDNRIDPVVPIHVPHGYRQGKINRPEAEVIADEIAEFIKDPTYNGRSFGVISLISGRQVQTIEQAIVDRIGADEYVDRQLRVGTSKEFQGAERDVMWLSMVVAPDGDTKYAAATKLDDLRRYNVAVSRARDQVRIVHSVRLEELSNPNDLRRSLLEYAADVDLRAASAVPGSLGGPVPEDHRIDPFDSLFEQRVHNDIWRRGYHAVPQFPFNGRKIDLAIILGNERIAVECDGVAWHGPDRAADDLDKRRMLERCGWKFHNFTDTQYYLDEDKGLGPLWELLEKITAGQRTSGSAPSDAEPLAKSSGAEDGPELLTPSIVLAPTIAPTIEPGDINRSARHKAAPEFDENRLMSNRSSAKPPTGSPVLRPSPAPTAVIPVPSHEATGVAAEPNSGATTTTANAGAPTRTVSHAATDSAVAAFVMADDPRVANFYKSMPVMAQSLLDRTGPVVFDQVVAAWPGAPLSVEQVEPLRVALERATDDGILVAEPHPTDSATTVWRLPDQRRPLRSTTGNDSNRSDIVAPYLAYSGLSEHPTELSAVDLGLQLRQIIAVEGPVTFDRVVASWSTSMGASRRIRSDERARIGAIVDDLIGEGAVIGSQGVPSVDPIDGQVLRLHHQPSVRLRTGGPRQVGQLPNEELVALFVALGPTRDEDADFRAALAALGRKKLGPKVRQRLADARCDAI